MGLDGVRPQVVEELQRRGQSDGSRIVGGAADLEGAGGTGKGVLAEGGDRGRAEVPGPATLRRLQGEVAVGGGLQFGEDPIREGQEPAPEGRVEPLVAPCGDEIGPAFGQVHPHRSHLLDDVGDQPDVTGPAHLGQAGDVDAVAARPLHRRAAHHPCSRPDGVLEGSQVQHPVPGRDGTDHDAVPFGPFHPGDRHLQELGVGDQHLVAGTERDRAGGDAQSVGGALDEGNVVLVGSQQPRHLGDGPSAGLVHGDVVG